MKTPARPARIPAHEMPEHLPAGAHEAADPSTYPDVQLQVYTHHSTEQTLIVPAVAEPLLVLVLSGSALVQERAVGQDWVANAVTADDFFLTMSHEPYEMRWETQGGADFQVVHVYLSQRLLDLAARDVLAGRVNNLQLRDVSGARDAPVSRLIRVLHQEVTGPGPISSLYLQGVAQALAIHLARNYRDEHAGLRPPNALPAHKLHRVIGRMERGLATEFSLAALAAEAGMSEFYFSRLFRRATGQSPSQYFIQMRMAVARRLLLQSTLSVIDIALEVGYGSPSHFAHVFKRHSGITPHEFRRG
ncbi:helix-turn-helix domain-containing protein [Pseudomonas sp. G.S.17]|uniref:helix-turn-helix domain-containing protein n=1 Tax=Pseudomonas sp. G.S.17 TaxID=3137451 RepID=UPI00311CADDA